MTSNMRAFILKNMTDLAGANSLKGQHHVAAQINFPDYSPEGKSA
jgi:hypothetical protein